MSSVLLGDLKPGLKGTVTSVQGGDSAVIQRLLEMGLVEGSVVEVVREAPFGGDPILVRVRGSLLGLRRSEARLVQVKLIDLSGGAAL